ncbi:tRNA 2-selenouridine(34) synthase MnmH [Salinibacillus xinjiangensis]|uniref:tRNA 2-selenouridine(34) synthase MnmH n=1 Tax=Salinibacillus xinjiangensis TaxID=1229268 RepID=A0A6G1X8U3_9BACI|nr:tRNA 2-selenouridine(34) synthase MnmH [Salinibacillus xinjiangensis]MRG87326.1 tRNA 2-selenouridine(34) synthase MnmH [Salinibacillus xinjiangensis]
MFQDIQLDELLKRQQNEQINIIDVRSPSEYKDAMIPNSVNIPVFSDEERAEVGTIYKQKSPEAARERGLEIFSEKLPRFVKEVKQLEGEKVVYCWRGGMRSKSAATVVDLAGVPVYRLEGGFRSYRDWVLNTLDTIEFKPRAIVLNGFTGTGKTKILHQLKSEGYPVLDLEGMANHRGSIFGQIGRVPHNQKKFNSLLVHELLQYQNGDYMLIEGESKRVGKAVIPDFLLDKKDQGIQFFIELPKSERVKIILEDYQPWDHQEESIEAFRKIKKRIHTPVAKEIEQSLENGAYARAVELLLEYYYDPRYQHSITESTDENFKIIQGETVEEVTEKIHEQLARLDKVAQ